MSLKKFKPACSAHAMLWRIQRVYGSFVLARAFDEAVQLCFALPISGRHPVLRLVSPFSLTALGARSPLKSSQKLFSSVFCGLK